VIGRLAPNFWQICRTDDGQDGKWGTPQGLKRLWRKVAGKKCVITQMIPISCGYITADYLMDNFNLASGCKYIHPW
jgi:hypothetical protein